MYDLEGSSRRFNNINVKAQQYQGANEVDRQRLLEELYGPVGRLAARIVWQSQRQELEDIVQEVAIAALDNLSRGKWSGTAPFSSYVVGIAKNIRRRHYREKMKMGITISLTPDDSYDEDGYDEDTWAGENGLFVQPDCTANLDWYGLTPAEREVVEFKYAGYKHREIAAMTGRKIGTVSNLASKARRKMLPSTSKN